MNAKDNELGLKLNSDWLFWFQLNQFSKFAMSGYQLQNENSKPSCKVETKFLVSKENVVIQD